MHNPESVLENDIHKPPWDFDIQTYHRISVRQLDLMIINKKERICWIVDFAVPADYRKKLKERKMKDKYSDLARELKKLCEHESDDYNCNWCLWYCHQWIGAKTGGLGNNGTSGDCPNYSIVALLRSARNREKSWRLEETCCHSNSSGKLSTNAEVKNSQGEEIMIIILNNLSDFRVII